MMTFQHPVKRKDSSWMPARRLQQGFSQRQAVAAANTGETSPVVHEVLRSPGQPLDAETRVFMETHLAHDFSSVPAASLQPSLRVNEPGDRFEREADSIADRLTSQNTPVPRGAAHDFSSVRIHHDSQAADSARALDAFAYTAGSHIVFSGGSYAPQTAQGRRLLAHELTHVLQQSGAGRPAMIQRQGPNRPRVEVRSPVVEETLTQVSDLAGALQGRPLYQAEINLARGVYGNSINYASVRIVPTELAQYTTVGNNIRVPPDFSIRDQYAAETLIHELTHVWQYQHGGTGYISVSLGQQIAGAVEHGTRDAAYRYTITPGSSFFDYGPEQQGMIVQNYFAMTRDQAAPNTPGRQFYSSFREWRGEPALIDWTTRQAEIAQELPSHQPLIDQMRASIPRSERQILELRARDVMGSPRQEIPFGREDLQLTPVRPLFELRF